MLTEGARALLKEPLIARMTTMAPDGYPHTVPVWFDVDGDDIVIIAVRSTRKVQHVLVNPKGSVSVGGDAADGGGYMIQGDFVVEEDPDQTWTRRLIDRYEEGEKAARDKAEWADLDIIVLRLKPVRVIKVA